MNTLGKEDLTRYNRQIILPELGITGQEKLKGARVLMIGAGGLGCPALQYLVAAGVGYIGIVDDDVVELSNLHRQILYGTADVGRLKSLVASEKLSLLNPLIQIVSYQERLVPENAEMLFSGYDLVLDGSDNFETRFLVNDTCVLLNMPFIFGAVFKFDGQVSVFNYEGGPVYRDVFPEAPAADQRPDCANSGVLGILPGVIGSYMAAEAIKVITGIGTPLSGRLLIIDLLDHSSQVFMISKAPSFSKTVMADQVPDDTGLRQLQKSGKVQERERELDMEEFKRLQQQHGERIFVIDVREPYEFEEMPSAGINIPLYDLHSSVAVLPSDKLLVFICQSGLRSRIAVQVLKDRYIGEMYSLGTLLFKYA